MAPVSAQLRELIPGHPAEELLPVLPTLSGLFPGDGLRRGCIVAVEGSGLALLCMALAAGVSAAGSWCAVVGMPQLGVPAAADAGVNLERLLLVPDPGPRWPQVVAALLEGCEVVLLRPSTRPPPPVARRLAAHTRRSDSALVVADAGERPGSRGSSLPGALWEEAHVRLRVAHSQWVGVGAGHGRLRGRRAQVVARGRGGVPIGTRWCWLPGPDGAVAAAEPGHAGTAERFCSEMAKARSLGVAYQAGRPSWPVASGTGVRPG